MIRPIPYRQWLELKEHYEDADEDDPDAWEWFLEPWENSPISDDHDRRFSDQFDTANGDIGDDALDVGPF